MNKNFRKTSIATLMSMALLTVFSSQSIAAVGDPVHSGLEEEYGALAIGIGSHAKGFNAVAIGASSKAGYVSGEGDSEVFDMASGSVALGNASIVYAKSGDGVAIGNHATVQAGSGIAIGAMSEAVREAGVKNAYLAPGDSTDLAWVSTHGAVSVGSDTVSRQITGVAAGSADTDAVNVAQLKALKAEGDGTYAAKTSLNSYALKNDLNSYKTEVAQAYLAKSDAQNTYATQDSLGDYLKSADASANYATQTNFSALDEKVTGLQNTLDSMSGESWDKIQETVTKLENLEKNGLLTITTPNAQQPQPEDPITPNPEQPSSPIQAANDEGGIGDGTGDVGGDTPATSNNEASLGMGGKLNFVGSSNILASVEGDNDGNVTVKLDMAQDANVNSLTANSVTTETLQATKITAQDMELSGKLTANEIVATTAIQAPTIQFTDGAALTYSKDSGRLTYTTPAAEGDGTRAGGETFSVATTKDGISFGADEGESVLVNLEDQKVDIKGGDQYVTTSIVANADGGATVQIKMTDEFKAALGNGNLDNGITIGAKDGYGEIRVQQGNVDMGGNRIQNVGNPIAAGDAANKQYVDSTARSLRNKINDVDKDLRAGVAMAMAVGNLPQAYMPGKSIVGVSAGTYHGQGGFALGLSHATDNRQWVFKGAASVDTRGNVGGTLSAGYQF